MKGQNKFMDNKMFRSKIMVLKKNALAQHMEPKFYDFLPEDFYQINKEQLMYMWHFLSDKDIAELYDIPARKVKDRRHDFNIKPVTSAIDRIERELYGREDWVEEELKSVLPFEYNNGNIPHTNSTPLNSEKEFIYMKATGIVRRIDDLGRIVIPKEIRKTLKVREGEPLEIYTDRDGQIILKKYSPMGEMGIFAKQYAEALAKSSGYTVCISDKDTIIAASGQGRRDLQDKEISLELEQFMEQRQLRMATSSEKAYIPITENGEQYQSQVIMPIVSEGDAIGSVVMLGQTPMEDSDKKLVITAAGFLGKQREE